MLQSFLENTGDKKLLVEHTPKQGNIFENEGWHPFVYHVLLIYAEYSHLHCICKIMVLWKFFGDLYDGCY